MSGLNVEQPYNPYITIVTLSKCKYIGRLTFLFYFLVMWQSVYEHARQLK